LHARYQVVLLTNGPSDLQRDKIAIVQLEPWIPRIFISGELGFWKPQPAIFRHVLDQLDCPPAAAVMVGDSLSNDIAGAAAVGLRTVWINRHGQPSDAAIRPDATLTDLRPLPALLAEWERAEAPSQS
jgi:putative hydrolase of the HAD superfamily